MWITHTYKGQVDGIKEKFLHIVPKKFQDWELELKERYGNLDNNPMGVCIVQESLYDPTRYNIFRPIAKCEPLKVNDNKVCIQVIRDTAGRELYKLGFIEEMFNGHIYTIDVTDKKKLNALHFVSITGHINNYEVQ